MSARVAAWSLAALGISLNVAYHVLDLLNEHRWAPPFVGTMVGVSFLVVGALIASNKPRNPIGWIYLAGLTLVSLGGTGNLSEQYAYYGLITRPGGLPAVEWVVWAGQVSLAVGFTTMVLFSLLLFPDGRLPSPRWRLVAAAAVVGIALTSIGTVLGSTTEISPGVIVTNPLGLVSADPVLDALSSLVFFFVIGVAIACIASVFARFRIASGVERQQLKWFAFGAGCIPAVLLGGTLFASLAPGAFAEAGSSLWPLSVAGIPIATAVAILRFRLYDIDVLINRTLVYGALSAALAVTYWLLVLFLQSALRPITAGNEVAVAASTLTTLALVQPLRSRIQRAVDRRFYRARFDGARTLDAFSVRLRDEVALDAVRKDLLDAVGQTVQPATASLWLRERGR
jgi:hypothetical protein